MRTALRSPVLLVVAGLMLLQAAWILTIPPFRGIDEIDHVYRATAVAHGEWVAGSSTDEGRGRLVKVPEDVVDAARGQCQELDYMKADNCSPASRASDGSVRVASAADSYEPVYYWIVGTPALPFEGVAALYVMRIVSALACLALIGLAAWALGKLPGRWPLAAMLLACTPVLVYSTTVVAPNGMEMCAALALWSSVLVLVQGRARPGERRLLMASVASAVVVAGLRPLGPLFVCLIVATVGVLNWRSAWAMIRRNARAVVAGALLVAVAATGQMLWTMSQSQAMGGEREESSALGLAHLLVWPFQTIAAFPFRDQMGAIVIYPVVGALTVALVIFALRRASVRERLVVISAFVLAYLLPIAFTLATRHSIGNIWQGRYGLPYAVGFVLISGYLLSRVRKGSALSPAATVPAALVYAMAVIACLVKIRHDELAGNPASSADPSWHEPALPLLVFLVSLAGLLCAAGLSRQGLSPSIAATSASSEGVAQVGPGGPAVATANGARQQRHGM